MSTPPDKAQPRSGRRLTIWPNLIWSIPVAALLIVGYLGIQALANRGERITVTFRRAADARAGDTKVLYQGAEAGQLVKISPNKDGRRIDFELRMIPAAKQGLNSNARFWLIGAEPTLSDLASLKAVVSGVAIGYAPGDGGTPTDTFDGLDGAPLILPGDKGTRYVLNARTLNSVGEGSVVIFHGQSIGKVTEVKFRGREGFRLEVFIYQPYDTLIKAGARFWKISPLRLAFTSGGVTANLAPSSTLLSGGIDLEVDTADPNSAQSAPETEFTLYSSHGAARQGLSGPIVRYEFVFASDAGTLEENAAVTLLGFQIGEVESRRLDFDAQSGDPFTVVTAAIYPRQLQIADDKVVHGDESRAAADAKLRRLVHAGFRARLQQTPMLVGDESIALVKIKNAPAADLGQSPVPRIPSAPGGSGLDDLTTQADQILTKINSIPIQEIGKNVGEVAAHLNTLVSSPELKDSLAHLQNTLVNIDKMLSDVQPQVGPLLTKLNETASQLSETARAANRLLDSEGGSEDDNLAESIRQLTEAARSIRSLTDYLGRHPEALLRGKKEEH